jgi:hypothetical protein
MLVAVSPYHLTTRETPAMAALLLADRVVTLLPEPGGQDRRAAAEHSARRIPRYLSFLQSWEWSLPLWESGVITGSVDDDDASKDVGEVRRRILADDRFADLRPLIGQDLSDNPECYLDAVAADLLKGGPDPALCVPIAAALDRFAVRHGAGVARSEPASVAQRAEERLGERLFTIGVPVLLQAGGRVILRARQVLGPELSPLRRALGVAAEHAGADTLAHLRLAARTYAEAFERHRFALTAPDQDDDARVVAGTVVIVGARLPIDAVLRSSLAACRAVLGSTSLHAGRGEVAGTSLAERDPLAGRSVTAFVIRSVGSGR